MNRFLERFQRLPRSQRWLVAFLCYGLIVVVFYFSLISTALAGIDSATTRKQDLTAQRDKVRARAENRAAFEEELEKLAAQLKQALKELPNDREIPGLLSEIDSLARKSGLEVRKFQPLPEIMHEFYAEVPVQMVMDGGYHEFGIFFDRVSKMNRIVSFSGLKMGDPRDIGPEVSLNTAGRVVTFRFLTDEEIAANLKRQGGAPAPSGGGGE